MVLESHQEEVRRSSFRQEARKHYDPEILALRLGQRKRMPPAWQIRLQERPR